MPINRDYEKFLTDFHSKKFISLRESQKYVLEEYANNFTAVSDVAIELPTGAGKTLISLLVAEAWRQDGRKVAILSANKTLARQMLQEAQALGIPAVLMEGRGQDIPASDKRGYQRATCVAIMNYWVYFNQNPVIDPADLLIMDDAHLAEHCLHSLYSLEIKKHEHEYLFNSLVAELQARFPEYSVLADAVAGDTPPTSSTELLSFIDQVDALDRIREIIDASPYQSADVDFGFRWRRIRN
jgi:type III restriction/modification enzyme restriction subunit